MRPAAVVLLALFALLAAACDDKKSGAQAQAQAQPPPPASAALPTYDPSLLANFAPLPAKLELPDNPLTEDKIALGRRLYFETRLSKGNDVACSSCHDPAKGGADGEPRSTGTKGRKTRFNAPTVFNAAGSFMQGWEGRAPLLEEFVLPHMADADVMDSGDGAHVAELLAATPAYAAAAKRAFPSEKSLTAEAMSKALSAYVRKLVTPGRWDRFLLGEQDALSAEEKAGLAVFLDVGCPTCHAGKYMGAAMNQKLGLAKPWPGDAGADPGRFAVTKQEMEKGVFKVPTLRNVTLTAPYLHDGSVASLDTMVRLMAKHQAGREIDDAKAKWLVAFLGALAGDAPKDLVAKPE